MKLAAEIGERIDRAEKSVNLVKCKALENSERQFVAHLNGLLFAMDGLDESIDKHLRQQASAIQEEVSALVKRMEKKEDGE